MEVLFALLKLETAAERVHFDLGLGQVTAFHVDRPLAVELVAHADAHQAVGLFLIAHARAIAFQAGATDACAAEQAEALADWHCALRGDADSLVRVETALTEDTGI